MLQRKRIRNKRLSEKSHTKQLEHALDKLVFDIVQLRDRKCVQCRTDNQTQLTPGHVFSRRVRATRWKLTNVYCQCILHNSSHEDDRRPFFNWVIAHIGQDKFNKLKKEWDTQTKLYFTDLEEMKKKLEQIRDNKDPRFWCNLTYKHCEFLHGRCIHCGEVEHLLEKESSFVEENLAARDWLNSED